MRFKTAMAAFALAFCTLGVVVAAHAQETSPKTDLFLGYSYMKPDVSGYSPHLPVGGGGTLTFNFNRYFGLSVDANYDQQKGKSTDYHDTTFMAGPRLMWRTTHFSPFLELMGGYNHVAAGGFKSNGGGGLGGGGIDIPLGNRISWRLIRVDFVYQHLHDGNDDGIRGQTGIVFNMGSLGEATKMMAQAACSVTPNEVLPGEPISATATPAQFNPKRTLTYAWTTTAGKLSSTNTATTQIDTNGVTPGLYKVSAHVTDGKKAMADCSQNFTVKELPKHPPTISCSADQSTVVSGTAATIKCTGNSEDKRPLTYTWQSSTGNIAGNNDSASLATNGITGPVTVTTTVTDDRGLSANTTTNLTVQAPPPPPPPPAPEVGSTEAIRQDLQQKGKALLNVHFDTAKATIRPESEPLLTNAAQVLTEDPSLYIYVDGYTDSVGSKPYNLALSRRRAASVRLWLTKHGVAAKRMVARGYGMENPVGDNSTEAGRQANRRVELVRMSDAEKAKAEATPAAKRPVHRKKAASSTTTTTTTTTTKKK